MKIEAESCRRHNNRGHGRHGQRQFTRRFRSRQKPAIRREFPSLPAKAPLSTGPIGTSDNRFPQRVPGQVLAVRHNRFPCGKLSRFFVQKIRLPTR